MRKILNIAIRRPCRLAAHHSPCACRREKKRTTAGAVLPPQLCRAQGLRRQADQECQRGDSLPRQGWQPRNEGFQLKTDTDGRASIDDIPYGRVRVQVLAHGLQTYGDDIEVKQPKQEIVIRLKPPAEQVSIYK